jgi:hypothetical protein
MDVREAAVQAGAANIENGIRQRSVDRTAAQLMEAKAILVGVHISVTTDVLLAVAQILAMNEAAQRSEATATAPSR